MITRGVTSHIHMRACRAVAAEGGACWDFAFGHFGTARADAAAHGTRKTHRHTPAINDHLNQSINYPQVDTLGANDRGSRRRPRCLLSAARTSPRTSRPPCTPLATGPPGCRQGQSRSSPQRTPRAARRAARGPRFRVKVQGQGAGPRCGATAREQPSVAGGWRAGRKERRRGG